MRAVGQHFLGGRRALGAVGADTGQPVFGKGVRCAGGRAERAEVPVIAVVVGLELLALEPQARFQRHRADVEPLDREHADLVGKAGRDERLVAHHLEVAVAGLHAPGAGQVAPFFLDQFQPAFPLLVEELGANLLAFLLGVLVVAIAEANARRVEGQERCAQLARDVDASLLHGDAHFRRLARLLDVHRDAVVRRIVADRRAEKAVVAHPGQAAGDAGVAHGAVGQLAAQFVVLRIERAQGLAAGEPRHGHVAGLLVGAVQMGDQPGLAQRNGNAARAGALVAIGAVEAGAGRLDAVLRDFLGDTPVDDVDHAARRAVAIEQRRRTAHHLDALGGGGIDRRGVVRAGGRGVERTQAIDQHTDAVAAQTADHRPAGAEGVAGLADAGQVAHDVAQAAAADLRQVLAVKNRRPLQHVELAGSQRRRGDDHLVDMAGMVRGLVRIGPGRRRESKGRDAGE